MKMNNSFINAIYGENTQSIPVWFMRQAGRYLPEYMKMKTEYTFREMSQTPELIKKVTLLPFQKYDLDAAILFSDILTCLEHMGSLFEFTETGPQLEDFGPDALLSLNSFTPHKDLHFVGEGLQLIKNELRDKPIIGFIGAPYTLASYILEGQSSRDFKNTRAFLKKNPTDFKRALDILAENLSKYLSFQVQNGVSAIQIFDSWGGFLDLETYTKHILPSLQRLIETFKSKHNVPVILYAQPTYHLLPALVQSQADVLSVDWRKNMGDYFIEIDTLSNKKLSLQGNIDPISMTLPFEHIKKDVLSLLDSVKEVGALNRFIFNVGHGLTPKTSTDTVGQVLNCVHKYR